jgi:Flp pilus assembly protein TadB
MREGAVTPDGMRRFPPDRTEQSHRRQPTAASFVAGILLVAAVPLILWAVTNPLAAGTVAAVVTATVGLVRRCREAARSQETDPAWCPTPVTPSPGGD